jgi:hypothetical protein
MTATNPVPRVEAASIIERVRGILLTPAAEWDKIEPESSTTQGLFIGYAGPLAALSAIAGLIGGVLSALIPHCAFGICVSGNPVRALIVGVVGAIVGFVIGLAGVFVAGIIVDELAPSFGGQKNREQALKVVVYSWTATWIAGVFLIIPYVGGLLSLAGLYSCYLLYLGLPKLMKAPADRALIYTIVSIVVSGVVIAVADVIVLIFVGIVGAMVAVSTGAITTSAAGPMTGTVTVGHTSVDLGQLSQAAQQAEAASRAMQAQANGQPAPAGSVQVVPADTLKAMLPGSIAGMPRTDFSSTTGSAGPIAGSNVSGTYSAGDRHVTLEITDTAGIGSLAAVLGAFSIESDHETQTGYDKVYKADGHMTEEEFDNQAKTGKYSVFIANRFVVNAEGSNVDIDTLKGAVAAVDLGRLQSLGHA